MTNFQGTDARRFSREQVLLWSPVLLGGVLAVAAGGFLVWPALQQLQAAQRQLLDLQQQEQQVPLLRAQLVKTKDAIETAQQRQRQILQLIAGSGDISTFMAQLGQEARLSGVQLDSYEPVVAAPAPPNPATPAQPAAKPDPNQPPPPPADPLLAPGLQKTSVLITARGSGPQLLDFLRRLERLSLLVAQSDLTLKYEAGSSGASGKPAVGGGGTTLKLNLKLYSKASTGGSPASPASQPAAAAAKS